VALSRGVGWWEHAALSRGRYSGRDSGMEKRLKIQKRGKRGAIKRGRVVGGILEWILKWKKRLTYTNSNCGGTDEAPSKRCGGEVLWKAL